MSTMNYDLVIIGSGPAGQKAAFCAAKLGRSVALVERISGIGGGCIHTGTVPSKAMREAVLHLTGLRERALYGDAYTVKEDITMADLLYRTQHVVRNEVDIIRSHMKSNGVKVVWGDAAFLDPNTVRVIRNEDQIDLRGDNVLVAVGTEPARPANVPFAPGRIIDSNELLRMKDLPRSLVIVGGGVIGVEYACMLAAVGVTITLVETRPKLLEFVDDEISEMLQYRMRDMGIRLRLGESVSEISVDGAGVEATLASNKKINAQMMLYTIGRQGATDRLNLPAAGLTADSRGRLKVNDFYQTEVPHIYAAGDVIGFPALAATSMEQGRLAACHMFHRIAEPVSPLYPLGIYTIPEISMVGQTEQALTASGSPYEIGMARFRETARGQLIGDLFGCLKLLFHPESRRLLGVHAIGTGATELIHIGQAVMAAAMPIDYFVESVFNYPTLAECYKVAALNGVNRLRAPRAEAEAVERIAKAA